MTVLEKPIIITENDNYSRLTGSQLFWIQGHMNYLSDFEIASRFHDSRQKCVLRALKDLREGKVIAK